MTQEEKTLDLYGRAKDWGYKTYDEALKCKIHYSNEELRRELKIDYRTRNTARVNRLIKAIKFNEFLLLE